MRSFSRLKSAIRLNELAQEPIDLTQEGILTSKRIDGMMANGAGLKLFYATERISDHVLSALYDLAEETGAVQKMISMQQGNIVNCIEGYESERRPALHTAMRDFFDMRNSSETSQAATQLAYKELEKLRAFLDEVETKERFTDLVQIGIGGSELGPKAVYIALEAYHKPNRRVHFLSNVDPDDGAQIFGKLNLEKTLVVVVSKSGSTLETLTNEQFAKEYFIKAGINPKVDKIAMKNDLKSNLSLLSALLGIWNRNFLSLPTVAIIPYSRALMRFPAHLQQLDMESNGKRIDKRGNPVDFDTGPVIWGEPGTNGQHSFYQLIHQGTTVVPLEFIGFSQSQYGQDVLYQGTSCQEKLLSNLFAQSIALAVGQKSGNPNQVFPGNRPNRILFGQKLDPFAMGAILAYYEHKVAFQGFIWNINSFDQEGVQLGKKLALKMV
ncbi:MAG: glucose-6-phosphate isomerase, partial [Chlamydiales bacterium]|nr:glucose-6-phosphate isomerase [Chlamydiales bacterium]